MWYVFRVGQATVHRALESSLGQEVPMSYNNIVNSLLEEGVPFYFIVPKRYHMNH